MGRANYPQATQLMITADGGGSNGSRVRLWKTQLQDFCNEIQLPIVVSHFPPGTSKWNKIEHRLFSHISMNWRGKPLTSFETILNLISSTTTTKGLSVQAGFSILFSWGALVSFWRLAEHRSVDSLDSLPQ